MKNTPIKIGERFIGSHHPPYVVAELSANHNGDINRAKEIIKHAKDAGADAVKLQSYTAETMTFNSTNEEFMVRGGLWDGKSLYELYQWAHMPWEWHKSLFDYAKEIGITIFSTPFDFSAIDLLEELNAPAYKIASFELVDTPLIRRVAKTKKPLIISTGMGTLQEIELAIKTARDAGCEDLIVLHCVSGYPTPSDQYNLRTMVEIGEKFDVLVGLSDHTIDNAASIASVSLGACFIEKHVTLSRDGDGPDDSFSIEPNELERLVHDSRTAWQSLGSVSFERQKSEKGNLKFRRSLYAVRDIKAGETFTEANIRSIRPGFGLAPKHYDEILTLKASENISAGQALKWELTNKS